MNEMQMLHHTAHGSTLWTFPYLALLMIILTIILSIYWIKRPVIREEDYRLDFFKIKWFKGVISKRHTQFIFQLPIVLIFIFLVITGIYGIQLAGRNTATVITWTFWWAGLIFAIFFFGKIWCYICPWYAVASWLKHLSFWKVKQRVVSFEKKWPDLFKNIYLATGFFILLTWLELGFGVTFAPKMTAYLGLLMLFMVVYPALIFKRSSFCRYGCLVGRVSGLYAMCSPVEIRARDRSVCKTSCKTSDCLMGNERGYPCPTFQYLGQMETNTYCIMCMECVKTCPHNNVAMNIRPFTSDLMKVWKVRPDEAYLTLIMLSLTIFHGITMTPLWAVIVEGSMGFLRWEFLPTFTLIMVIVILIPFIIHLITITIQRPLFSEGRLAFKDLFISFSYPLLPIALTYHLAHNLGHLLMEGKSILRVISDPFGWGWWDIIGTADIQTVPILSHLNTQKLQVILLFLGQYFALRIAVNIVNPTVKRDTRQGFIIILPVIVGLLIFSIFNLWLLFQPMDMRTAL